jgi:hypothetical protein
MRALRNRSQNMINPSKRSKKSKQKEEEKRMCEVNELPVASSPSKSVIVLR